jgi:hypothetical protein
MYIESIVDAELTAIANNPAIMTGAGGPGVSFHTRLHLRAAAFELLPGLTNVETYQPTSLAGTINVRARSKATK